jgi:chorismate mutase
MYFGIGFLVATLLGLLIVLRVHHRTQRLGSIDQFHPDVRQLEQQLAVALGERSKLQREIALIKRDAELTWAAERVESALYRERINDVASEVVRITQTLESRGSSIEPTPVYSALLIGQGSTPPINAGAIADRVRALRTMVASRAAVN